MERGDLEVSTRPRIVVVLEGALAGVTPVVEHTGWLRRSETIDYVLTWQRDPLARVATMKRQWPDVAIDVVTFISQEVADLAAEFFLEAGIPIDAVSYRGLDRYTSLLQFQSEITMVVDSDSSRLDRYGQLGHAVVFGKDW